MTAVWSFSTKDTYTCQGGMPEPELKKNQFIQHGAGNNLLHLLGFDGCRQVLVIGSHLTDWRSIFPGCHYAEKCTLAHDSGYIYDLILYHSCSTTNWKGLQGDLRQLVSNVSKNGWILVFAENYWTPANIKNHKQFLAGFGARFRFRPSAIRKAVEVFGQQVVKTFVGMPSFNSAEELVLPTSRFLELPRTAHRFFRLTRKIGCYHCVADGLVLLAGLQKVEESSLFKILTERLRSIFGADKEYTIERLDIRLRGALILFIVEHATQKSFICRIISDPIIQTVVRRNQDFLTFFRQSLIGQDLIDRLPIPILELKRDQCVVFIETLIEGVPAWKINDTRMRRVIFDAAFDFIMRFQTAMRHPYPVPGSQFKELLKPDLCRLLDCTVICSEFLLKIQEVAQKLFGLAAENQLCLTAGHGDYGYGNILVNPETGQLAGVIDWDTGRLNDLPGIDYLNLLVQKYRSETGCGVAVAFIATCGAVLQRGGLDDRGFYTDAFNFTGGLLKLVLHSCLIRYMSRAAQYPDVFAKEQDDYRKILTFFEEFVPL